MSKIRELLELIQKLPEGLRSDWDGTNHYELTSGVKDDYWWLDVPDVFVFRDNWSANEDGQRLGLIMDIAAKAKAAEKEIQELAKEKGI